MAISGLSMEASTPMLKPKPHEFPPSSQSFFRVNRADMGDREHPYPVLVAETNYSPTEIIQLIVPTTNTELTDISVFHARVAKLDREGNIPPLGKQETLARMPINAKFVESMLDVARVAPGGDLLEPGPKGREKSLFDTDALDIVMTNILNETKDIIGKSDAQQQFRTDKVRQRTLESVVTLKEKQMTRLRRAAEGQTDVKMLKLLESI